MIMMMMVMMIMTRDERQDLFVTCNFAVAVVSRSDILHSTHMLTNTSQQQQQSPSWASAELSIREL